MYTFFNEYGVIPHWEEHGIRLDKAVNHAELEAAIARCKTSVEIRALQARLSLLILTAGSEIGDHMKSPIINKKHFEAMMLECSCGAEVDALREYLAGDVCAICADEILRRAFEKRRAKLAALKERRQ